MKYSKGVVLESRRLGTKREVGPAGMSESSVRWAPLFPFLEASSSPPCRAGPAVGIEYLHSCKPRLRGLRLQHLVSYIFVRVNLSEEQHVCSQ